MIRKKMVLTTIFGIAILTAVVVCIIWLGVCIIQVVVHIVSRIIKFLDFRDPIIKIERPYYPMHHEQFTAESYRDPLHYKHIKVVKTLDECENAVSALKRHCSDSENKVLGFDCEWVAYRQTRYPVALLQLSSHQGFCALFRLCNFRQFPKCLRELLEDDEIIKVGVAPQDDALKLAQDYGVNVASTFDLRFLASMTGHKPEGLKGLSKTHLNVELDKTWAWSNWQAIELNNEQLDYAANDALVAVEIFYILAKELDPVNFEQFDEYNFRRVRTRLERFFGATFNPLKHNV